MRESKKERKKERRRFAWALEENEYIYQAIKYAYDKLSIKL